MVTLTMTSVVRFAVLERWDSPQSPATGSFAWPVVSLGEAAQVRLGLQVPRKGSKPVGVARQYLRSANVRRGRLDLSDVKTMHLSENLAADLELQPGDLLFVEGSGSVSEVGRTAIWDGSLPKVVHQNSVVRARLHDERLDPAFVVTWFNCRAGNAYIREQATTTSGLYHIGAGKLAGVPIPVPPLNVQQELVAAYEAALQRADDAEQAAARLAESAWGRFATQVVDTHGASAAADLVTVTRFAALDRWDTNVVSIGVTSPYPLVRLDDIADVRLGTQVPRKGSRAEGVETPYLRAANVQRGHLNLADMKTMRVPLETVQRLDLSPGDVLFVEGNSREEVGRSAVWTGNGGRTIIQNSVVRARLTTEAVHPEFMSTWFNSKTGGNHVYEQATTTSGSLWHIGAGKLAAAPLPVPPLDMQIALVRELNEGLAASSAAADNAVHLREQAEANLRDTLSSTPPDSTK
jgi:type I restriction enzyme S subunit